MKKQLVYLLILLVTFLSSCSHTLKDVKEEESTSSNLNTSYINEMNAWHQERIQSLKKPDSWLALSGLFWLKEGANSFGSAAGNDMVFPENKIASSAGSFVLDNDKVVLKLNPEVKVEVGSDTIEGEHIIFENDKAEEVTYGPLKWVIIKRGDKYGLRLWDAENEALKSFSDIERYPVNQNWKLNAVLVHNPLPKRIAITNVLGQTSYEPSPGVVVFNINGKSYRLDALEEGEELFIIFGDRTNGAETYGSGRYLYIPKPDADGKTVIDFNKAYNPPCAFTGYATCPLPPKQNLLPIKIEAGEKNFNGHH